MAPQGTKYSPEWEDQKDSRGVRFGDWLKKIDEFTAFCESCNKNISVSNLGKRAIVKHSKTQSHIKKCPANSTAINNESHADESHIDKEPELNYTLNDSVCKAEILWSVATAEHDISFLTSDHVAKLFPKMFPDSAIAAGMKCSRTKTMYLIKDGISVSNIEKLKEKLSKNVFSLLIDESNKKYGEKFLCIMVRFYDEEKKVVQTKFLDVKNCNESNADNITKLVVDSMEENNLSFENLIQIMSDSCNVMRGIHKGVTQLRNKHAKHVIDIGGCSLHHVSNACEHALKDLFMFDEMEELAQDTSTFFSYHVHYADKLKDLQKALALDEHRLLKHCSVRFLSLYPVVNRLLEQFPALQKLFTQVIPEKDPKVAKQSRVVRIIEAIKCKYTLPTLYFIKYSLESFQKYEKFFQKSTPTIHIMHSKQIDLYRDNLLQFCKFDSIEKLKSEKDIVNFDYKNKINMLSFENMNIGRKAKQIISKFETQERMVFLKGVQVYYTKLSEHLLKNLSLSNLFLANLEFLNPVSRTMKSEDKIHYCAKKLPPGAGISYIELDTLRTEWKNLVLDKIPKDWFIDDQQKYKPIDEYWTKIMQIKDAGNENKYPVISKVVRSCFAVAEANADVERLFSQISHIVQQDRNRLSIECIKGILHSKEICLDVEVDDRMMYNAKAAHSRYALNLAVNKASADISLKRRLEQEVENNRSKDKRLKEIEEEEKMLQENEDHLKLLQAQAMLKHEETKDLMEKQQKMNKIISTKRKSIEKKKSKLDKNVMKSTCQEAAKNLREFINRPSTSKSDKNKNESINRPATSKSDKNKKESINRPATSKSDENNNDI